VTPDHALASLWPIVFEMVRGAERLRRPNRDTIVTQ
jgi:hypothetical protein